MNSLLWDIWTSLIHDVNGTRSIQLWIWLHLGCLKWTFEIIKKKLKTRYTLLTSTQYISIQVYDSNSIWTFHNLVTHHGANKQAPELMMQCLAAIFLLRCLKGILYPISPSGKNTYLQCWTYITDHAIFNPRFFLDFFYFLKN